MTQLLPIVLKEIRRRELWPVMRSRLKMRLLAPIPEQQKAIDLGEDVPALIALAEKLAPALKRRFLAAVKALQSKVDVEALAKAIEANQLTAMEAAVKVNQLAETYGELAIDLKAGFMVGAGLSIRELAQSGVELGFNVINPRAVAYAGMRLEHDLVPSFKEDIRDILKDLLQRSLSGEFTPAEAARRLRDSGSLGLDLRRVKAADNFYQELLEQGVPEDKIQRRMGRYMDQLLLQRAETIARTETTRAAVKGERATWDEAAKLSLFNADNYERVWMVTGDDRLCDECEPLDGTAVDMDEEFPGGDPPLHPNCRCTINRMRKLEGDGRPAPDQEEE